MIFGYQLTLTNIMYGGYVTFAVLVVQMLIGTRRIKFKGRTHAKVHRYTAWTLTVLAAGHGLLGLTMVNNWRIF